MQVFELLSTADLDRPPITSRRKRGKLSFKSALKRASRQSADQSMNAPRFSGFWNADVVLSKTVVIYENISAQFRVNAFNAFNPSQFAGNPQFAGFATVDSATAGRIMAIANGTIPHGSTSAFRV